MVDRYVYKCIFILALMCLFSCGQSQKYIPGQGLIKKALFVPEKLVVYTPFENYLLDSTQIAKSPFKIYVSINFSCPTCIEKVNKWAAIVPQIKAGRNIPVIIIANTDDDFMLIKYLIKKKAIAKFPYPFFLNKTGDFTAKNDVISKSAEMDAVLTDQENTIIYQGNPLKSPEAKERFLQKIRETQK
ncbi:hypothetical protein [Pedobacter miscanthi]|uniref:hypothetical protein n=1 Tax=Pedobacter miscanthi TaxID=2259170 RepID=UPI002930BE8B|nr:hypothetical protein [Pedobacter miscanthi]